MERGLSVNSKQIADKLTTELGGNYEYIVKDDVMYFNDEMKLNNGVFIPCVLTLTQSFKDPNKYLTTDNFTITFRVNKDYDKALFLSDLKTFIDTQANELIDGYYVTKVYNNPQFVSEDIINSVDYLLYSIDFTWTFALSKVGSMTVISVDSVQIPFVSCDVSHDVSYVSNQSSAVNYRMTNDVITITVPLIVANARVLSLYQDINSDTYNKVYTLNIDGNAKSVVLKRGQYTFNNSAVITNMILTFETAYPRVTVEVDGDLIPVTAYQYMAKSTIDQSARSSDVQKGWANDKVRSWSITFVNNDSTAFNKLFNDAYGDTLGITYTLDIGLASTFTVILAEAVERYTETGDMTLECQFIEYA